MTFRLLIVITILTTGVLTASASNFKAGSLVQVTGASPFANCTADNVASQAGTNFLNSEVEPWVDVNPTNPKNIVGGVQQDRWSTGGARGLVASVSFNGGKTWQNVVIPGLTLCSGGTFQRASDPWLSFAPNGDLYFLSLVSDVNPGGLLGDNAILVNKSTDGGLTWSDPITLIRDITPARFDDKQSITADPTDPNFVYAVWDRSTGQFIIQVVTEFARTTDAGETWETRVIYRSDPDDGNIGHQIVVLPDGTLVDVFTELRFHGAILEEILLSVIRSGDKGATWSPVIRASDIQPAGVTDPETGDPVRAGGILAEVAVDRNSGALYAVWQDSRFSGVSSVAFSQSTDGGFTWSAPVKINKTPSSSVPGNMQAFTPSVDVAADGTIAVTYYDFRNNTSAAALLTDYFVIHCHPPAGCTNPANWGNEIRLTNTSFDMRQAPFAGGFFVGDYEGLASGGNDFVAFFSQPHGSDPASVFFRRVGP